MTCDAEKWRVKDPRNDNPSKNSPKKRERSEDEYEAGSGGHEREREESTDFET